MNDIFQSALRVYYFEGKSHWRSRVKSRTGHFLPLWPFSPPFFGVKNGCRLRSRCCGRSGWARGFCLASGVFSSRFRALIIAKQRPPASAPASTALLQCRYAIIKPPGRDGHMPGPSSKPPRVRVRVREKAKPKHWGRFSPKTVLVRAAADAARGDTALAGKCVPFQIHLVQTSTSDNGWKCLI